MKDRLTFYELILPILVPSWRFFDTVNPSPRIEYRLIDRGEWQEFRPRPQCVSFFEALKRLFYSPEWNESLYLVSCAERIINGQVAHSEDEIKARIMRDLATRDLSAYESLQFRIYFISRDNENLRRDILHHSPIYTLTSEVSA